MSSFPARSILETHAILTSPGLPFETEEKEINGLKLRTYKNLPGSLRDLWIGASTAFADKDYIVYEDKWTLDGVHSATVPMKRRGEKGERITYGQAQVRVNEIATMLHEKFGCRKGDKVAIAARNLPEWILSFWAIEILGGIACTVNAWLTLEASVHCITICDCRVVLLDSERANQLAGSVDKLQNSGAIGILVFREKAPPTGMLSFEAVLGEYIGSAKALPKVEIEPEDHATILFTSGTTGLPKGVLGTQRNYLTNIPNSLIGVYRATLRRGDPIPVPDPTAPQKAMMITVPLFHATGNHSTMAVATTLGAKICLIYKWSTEKVAKMIIDERVSSAGGMPFMAMELVESFLSKSNHVLESIGFGGGPAPGTLAGSIASAFPGTQPHQGYGATEVSSAAATFNGEDFILRPTSTGLPCPVVDIKIVDDGGNSLPPGGIGEIYIRGPNRTLGYWKAPEATKEVFLDDGFYRSGDIGYLDEEGFLYILDRAKDLIIRGGENIASVTVENALYLDHRIIDVAVFAIPDAKLGELVAAAVVTKPEYHGRVTEAELVALVANILPKHCVPVIVDIRSESLPRNGTGKTLKKDLKVEVARLWEERKATKGKAKL